MHELAPRYVGFWMRFIAFAIDTIVVSLIIMPILIGVYGLGYLDLPAGKIAGPIDFLLSMVAPPLAAMAFLVYKKATPGKMVIGAEVVDATTGAALSKKQVVMRYAGYIIGSMAMGLGLLWVAFDRRKQGWHDKLAHSVVIKRRQASADDSSETILSTDGAE
jgi:uncharacterized RDD family membrane protein YckC